MLNGHAARLALACLGALCVVGHPHAAPLTATPATLAAVLAQAQPGDEVTLAPGPWGDVAIRNTRPAGLVRVHTAGAALRSLSVIASAHLALDGLSIAFTPDAKTTASTAALLITGSSDISVTGAQLVGGPAVNGVAQDATALDATGNVQGLPAGYGVSVSRSDHVTLDHLAVAGFDHGVILFGVTDAAITGSDIHDLRRTPIAGSGLQRVTITGNHLHDIKPWRWGQTPLGDHADFMAFWTDPAFPGATQGLRIVGNLMEQGQGTAVLGPWIQGQTQGFDHPEFAGNVLLNGNAQGFTAKDATAPWIHDNTFLQASGDVKAAPGVLLSGSTQGAVVERNVGLFNDLSASKANTAQANVPAPSGVQPPFVQMLARRALNVAP